MVEALVGLVSAPKSQGRYPGYWRLDRSELHWTIKLLYRLLVTSVDSGNRMLILNYFQVSGRSRFEAGFTADEMARLLTLLGTLVREHLQMTSEFRKFSTEIHDAISMPIEFGIDEIRYQHQLFRQQSSPSQLEGMPTADASVRTAREQLEETIWNCLVQRK